MTDTIADAITRLRNANRASKDEVDIPFSKMNQEIMRVLKEEGFIKSFKFMEDRRCRQGMLKVFLKYGPSKEKIINEIKRISRPGLRTYVPKAKLPKVYGGVGVAIVTTSKGIMTDAQCREKNVGGEILFTVW